LNTIEVEHLFKRYNYHPIIKDFSFTFLEGKNYAIRGSNGSGKSTLVNLLAGYLSPSKGKIYYFIQGKPITRNEIFRYINVASPYCSLVEDFTLFENYEFFKKFKNLQNDVSYNELLALLEWKDPMDKHFSKFSSGMKQKASLALAFLSQSPILFLDEPTSFLDIQAKDWYRNNFIKFNSNKTIILASNDEIDFVDIYETVQL
jgi:ABC-type multidrug transport system ATPase subunit